MVQITEMLPLLMVAVTSWFITTTTPLPTDSSAQRTTTIDYDLADLDEFGQDPGAEDSINFGDPSGFGFSGYQTGVNVAAGETVFDPMDVFPTDSAAAAISDEDTDIDMQGHSTDNIITTATKSHIAKTANRPATNGTGNTQQQVAIGSDQTMPGISTTVSPSKNGTGAYYSELTTASTTVPSMTSTGAVTTSNQMVTGRNVGNVKTGRQHSRTFTIKKFKLGNRKHGSYRSDSYSPRSRDEDISDTVSANSLPESQSNQTTSGSNENQSVEEVSLTTDSDANKLTSANSSANIATSVSNDRSEATQSSENSSGISGEDKTSKQDSISSDVVVDKATTGVNESSTDSNAPDNDNDEPMNDPDTGSVESVDSKTGASSETSTKTLTETLDTDIDNDSDQNSTELNSAEVDTSYHVSLTNSNDENENGDFQNRPSATNVKAGAEQQNVKQTNAVGGTKGVEESSSASIETMDNSGNTYDADIALYHGSGRKNQNLSSCFAGGTPRDNNVCSLVRSLHTICKFQFPKNCPTHKGAAMTSEAGSMSRESVENLSASFEKSNGIYEIMNLIRNACPSLCALALSNGGDSAFLKGLGYNMNDTSAEDSYENDLYDLSIDDINDSLDSDTDVILGIGNKGNQGIVSASSTLSSNSVTFASSSSVDSDESFTDSMTSSLDTSQNYGDFQLDSGHMDTPVLSIESADPRPANRPTDNSNTASVKEKEVSMSASKEGE